MVPRAGGSGLAPAGAAEHTGAKEAPPRGGEGNNPQENGHCTVAACVQALASAWSTSRGSALPGASAAADFAARREVRAGRKPRAHAALEGEERTASPQRGPTQHCGRRRVALRQTHRLAHNWGSLPQGQARAPQPVVRGGRERPPHERFIVQCQFRPGDLRRPWNLGIESWGHLQYGGTPGWSRGWWRTVSPGMGPTKASQG